MARLLGRIVFACAAGSLISTAIASDYQISVTRKGSNLYKVDGQQVFIRTNYCYEYAYSEAATLQAVGSAGSLNFLRSQDECPVKAVLGASQQTPGKYQVDVTQEGDDWYEVSGQNVFVHTSGCFNMAMNEDAVLDLYSGGSGTLEFENDKCTVDGIYSKLRL
ncbi:unnamed protein product [Pseudomonas viridiflava]|uniref:Lipoprotein n=2 Tax=Pseudomonas viridiflava TaxID=33069 RepID=A0A1Y6JRT8_PSEVI|nr:unnamed protein product [Pseudomonas viridiflava]